MRNVVSCNNNNNNNNNNNDNDQLSLCVFHACYNLLRRSVGSGAM
jgi:hypothetical protein